MTDPAHDSLIERYYGLKDRELQRDGVFICEGRTLVRRLLVSDYKTESVLCAPRFLDEFRRAAAGRFPVLSLSEEDISAIAGFPFHRGVLACGLRRPIPAVDKLPENLPGARRAVILADLTGLENVGGIIRSAAALGMDAVILGGRCADPFGRKALKASMGTVFKVPLFRCILPADLTRLAEAGWSIIGSVTSPEAIPVNEFLPPPKTALLLGGEALGLSSGWIESCDSLITIPMKPGIDSLNVSTAAGILMYAIKNPPPRGGEEGL